MMPPNSTDRTYMANRATRHSGGLERFLCTVFPGSVRGEHLNFKFSSLALAFTLLLFYSIPGSAMSMFKPMIMFSEVRGTVVENGKPVEGAQVVQQYQWSWNDKTYKSTVKTDRNG